MRKIVIDCAGGDNSPNAPIEGALSALEKFPDLYVILCGKEEEISSILSEKAYDGGRVEILNASDVITCHDKPTDAVRLKKDSSMMRSLKLLREDDGIFGMVSTGSTGALVCGATLRIGRIKGVIRPAFCPILPTMDGGIVGICDTGANIDITPEHLRQFAVMGSLYLRCAFGVESPNVGLLNIGTEAEKGDALRKEAYPLLSETEEIRFGGNMEARELLEGKFDLVCCDGFSGNVLIKATEGACLEMLKKLKKDIFSSWKNKLGAFIMRKMFAETKEFMNYQNYGGSVLLGTSKVIVKGHGSSDARAVCACISQAYRMESASYVECVEDALLKIEQRNREKENV
ncbi:MAG: phosphate acyltransferase PlsX [Clostridia bacterium]|nr:phosphate acyltransferase PlsX [Clostridia bacterium]